MRAGGGTDHRRPDQPRGFGRSSRLGSLLNRDDRMVGEHFGLGRRIDGGLAGACAPLLFAARREVTTTASSAWITSRLGPHGRRHRNPVRPSVPAAPVSASPNGRHQTLPILASSGFFATPTSRPSGADGADSQRLILLMRRGLSNMKINSISARRLASMWGDAQEGAPQPIRGMGGVGVSSGVGTIK